jgi:hypothetical protein
VINLRQQLPWYALLCALLFSSCNGEEEGRVLRLERLVFVAPLPCVLLPETVAPVVCSNDRALLVDRFEVTQDEWQAWLENQGSNSSALECQTYWPDLAPTLPATGMTLTEAREFAEKNRMRVPTAREWIRVATGTRAQYYPWGRQAAESVANTLELKLGTLAPVGTFDKGCTPSGVYDLLGNVAEWVLIDDIVVQEDGRERFEAWAMGGGYLSNRRQIYWLDYQADLGNDGDGDGNTSFNRRALHEGHRSRDLGLRLIVDAEEWLRVESKAWDLTPESIKRLQRIGNSWGSQAVPLLKKLEGESGAAQGLAELLRGAQS